MLSLRETLTSSRPPRSPQLVADSGADPESCSGGEGFRIGPWRVEPAICGLRHREGDERHLRPQEMDLLCCLAAAAGRVVSREEILTAVWADAQVEEGAISRCVSLVRKALGDEAKAPRYIETISKRGYRLIAPVERKPPVEAGHGRRRRVGLGRFVLAAAAAAVILAAVALESEPEPARTAATERDARARSAQGAAAAAGERPSVAVLGFTNLSGSAGADWVSTALAEMLATELASAPGLRVIAGETVALMKRDLSLVATESLAPETLQRIGASLGADLVVVGSYLADDGADRAVLRLDLKLQDTASGEMVSGLAEIGSLDRLADLVAAAGVRLRERLGAPPPDRSWTPAASHLPEDPEAVRLYAEGLGKLRRFEAAAARDLLLAAVEREPHQPLAHLALAEAWAALGHDAQALEAAGRAGSQVEDLPRALELWVEASHLAFMARWDEAIERYDALWVFIPENLEYALRLAETQNAASRPADALATVQRIRRRAGAGHRDPRLALVTADAARLLGDFDRSLAAAARAIELGEALHAPSVAARGRHLRALALNALGRFPEATAALEEARAAFAAAGDRRSEAGAERALADWLTDRGSYDRAEELAARALETFRAIGDRKGEAAALRSLAMAGRDDAGATEAALRQALAIYGEINDRNGQAGVLQTLGILKGSGRELGEATELFRRALAIFREAGDQANVASTQSNLGKVRLMELAPAEAAAHLREAESLARELGLKGLLANVRFNQGYAGWLSGDPESAGAAFTEAIDLHRQLENPRMIAASLQGLGEIHLLRGDLEAARTCVEEALAGRLDIAGEAGSKGVAAMESLAVLSGILLELRRPDTAERTARDAAEAARLPLALTAVARTLLAQDRIAEAGRFAAEAARLLDAAERLSDVELRHRIVAARIQAAAGDGRAARELLAATSAEARAAGAWTLQAESELFLGAIEIGAGDREGGAARLAALEAEARARGVHLFADKAREARRGYGPVASGGRLRSSEAEEVGGAALAARYRPAL